MLLINKILCFLRFFIVFFVCSFNFSVLANNNSLSPEKLINQVEHLFKQNAETLNYQNVVGISNQIINQRINYPSEIVAKTYLLLASVAINKGELETALQFTHDGLAIATNNQAVILPLQINLAQIFSEKKQYQQLLTAAQQAVSSPQKKENTRCFLIALSYRSVAYSMLGQHTNALSDLQQVEAVIQENPAFSEHIFLLTILANAHYHLGDYQTALMVQSKILQLRFNLNRLNNIDQTYFHLANAYYRLDKFNDAYTAYWEAKDYALKKEAPIHIAYASQGLALTLLRQKQFNAAKTEATQAAELFHKHNLATPYLESIIILSQIYHAIEQEDKRFSLLLKAEKLITNIKLSPDFFIVYQSLANMYHIKKDPNKAYLWQKKYSDTVSEHLQFTNKIIKFNNEPHNNRTVNANNNFPASTKSRELAMKLAEQSELTSSFTSKFRTQRLIIIISTVITFILLVLMILLWVKQHRKKLLSEYEALEKPSYLLANAVQTKQLYQTNFNMARQYNYPLTLSYISITNWQELTFQFNKKTVLEVSRGIARLINEQLSEFESAGVINNGEFLLSFPHQNKEQVTKKIERLVSSLKLRYFANLGEFSVIVAYSIESPSFQDIDPYIFLSRLSDSIKFGE